MIEKEEGYQVVKGKQLIEFHINLFIHFCYFPILVLLITLKEVIVVNVTFFNCLVWEIKTITCCKCDW